MAPVVRAADWHRLQHASALLRRRPKQGRSAAAAAHPQQHRRRRESPTRRDEVKTLRGLSSKPALAWGFVALAALAQCAAAELSTEKGRCQFVNEPLFPGYYWDPECRMGKEGCHADGRNVQCRFCGGGGYRTPCPPSACDFPASGTSLPYYWDPSCAMGKLGCWADGVHAQCRPLVTAEGMHSGRFCGAPPYLDIACPERLSAAPRGAKCDFFRKPETPHFWDPACKAGMHGCLADGKNEQCRWCGEGVYADIPCPASRVCGFDSEPALPYYWEPSCEMGMKGCIADGQHVQCRFCSVHPFEDIPCPEELPPAERQCSFPLHSAPKIPLYWEPGCERGMLGCWADGVHAECRFCGEGDYENITCPDPSRTPPGGRADEATSIAAAKAVRARAQAMVAKDIQRAADMAEEIVTLGGSRPRSECMGALVAMALWAAFA